MAENSIPPHKANIIVRSCMTRYVLGFVNRKVTSGNFKAVSAVFSQVAEVIEGSLVDGCEASAIDISEAKQLIGQALDRMAESEEDEDSAEILLFGEALMILRSLEFLEDGSPQKLAAVAKVALDECFRIDNNLLGARFVAREIQHQEGIILGSSALMNADSLRRVDLGFSARLAEARSILELQRSLFKHGLIDPFAGRS